MVVGRAQKRRLGLEPLERRQLLAAQISELLVDPLFGDNDTAQMVELRGEPGATLGGGTYLLVVSERSTSEGEIHGIFDLSGQRFGSSGYLVLLQQGSPHVPQPGANVLRSTEDGFGGLPGDLYQDSHSISDRIAFTIGANAYLLVQSDVPPAIEQDIDTDDDGSIDPAVAAAWDVLDSISLHPFVGRGDHAYGDVVFAEIGSSPPEIAARPGVEVVPTEGYGYAGRVGESTGSDPSDWIAGTVQNENSSSQSTPRWALADNLFGTPSQYAFAGRDLDHVGGPNFVGGVRGEVRSAISGEPSQGATVLADTNGNGTRDVLTHVVDPDDVVDRSGPDHQEYPLLNAFPGVTVTNFALESFSSQQVTAERESDFPDRLANRIFAKGAIDWFTQSGALRFDFYRPVSSASVTAIGSDNAFSSVYGRLDAFNADGELIDTAVSSRLVDSQREAISVSAVEDEIAYVMAYADQSIDGGGPFGRFDRLVYSQLEPAATADAAGRYEIRHLFPGEYTLSVLGARSTGEPPAIEVNTYENFVRDFSGDPNQPPSVTDAHWSIPENATAGEILGSVEASDFEGDPLRYRFAAAGDHGLVLDPDTGAVSIGEAAELDFEAQAQWVLPIVVTDASGLRDEATITIDVTDVNESPVAQQRTYDVSETTSVGSSIGSAATEDLDSGQTLRYEMVGGTGAELVEVDAATGAVTLAGQLDFETLPEWTVEVRASDDADPPLSATSTLTFVVRDVNEPPIFRQPLSPPDATTGEEFIFNLPPELVYDPENDPVITVASLANEALPAWLTFDREAMSFRGVPTSRSAGPVQVTLRAFSERDPAALSAMSFEFQVNLSSTPLYNTTRPHDVTGDEHVTALDALHVINFLSRKGDGFAIDSNARYDLFYDVSGDNLISSIDVLRVINQLSRQDVESAAGEPAAAPRAAALLFDSSDPDEERRIQDAALERYLSETSLF